MTAPRCPLLLVLHLLVRACASTGYGVKASTTVDRLIGVAELNTAKKQMHRERGASPEGAGSREDPAYPDEAAPQAPAAVAFDAVGVPSASAKGLAVFTLVRGGFSEADYESFISSRRCLDDVMPAWFPYDHVAFHEGNVPAALQHACAAPGKYERGTL
eukprot:5459029-Prymnesium_polylepis.1